MASNSGKQPPATKFSVFFRSCIERWRGKPAPPSRPDRASGHGRVPLPQRRPFALARQPSMRFFRRSDGRRLSRNSGKIVGCCNPAPDLAGLRVGACDIFMRLAARAGRVSHSRKTSSDAVRRERLANVLPIPRGRAAALWLLVWGGGALGSAGGSCVHFSGLGPSRKFRHQPSRGVLPRMPGTSTAWKRGSRRQRDRDRRTLK